MIKSLVMTFASIGLSAAGTSTAVACCGGACGMENCDSVPAPPVASASANGIRHYTYESGYRPPAASVGRSTMADYGGPSFGVRPAENKPLGRLP